MDPFDNEVPEEWRSKYWSTIRRTPFLRWQLVTKRVGNVVKMLPGNWHWGPIQALDGVLYSHVGIIATTVNQAEYDRDAPKLFALKGVGVRWVGLSIEPQIGPINLSSVPNWRECDWVICGGESRQVGSVCREFKLEWAESLRAQCAEARIPFFIKQIGSLPTENGRQSPGVTGAGKIPAEWRESLRVQEMPRVYD